MLAKLWGGGTIKMESQKKISDMSERWHVPYHTSVLLKDAIKAMEPFALAQEEVPFIIKLIENPKYDIGLFAGYVDLFTHDCIHIVLGRGLAVKDEAFVIGYTMGSTKRMLRWRRNLFMFCSKYLYPKGYKFGEDERFVFNSGIMAGSKCPSDLSKVNFNHLLNLTTKEIKILLGINQDMLTSCYKLEKCLFRESYESQRLH
jgi:hypothetical protein